MTALNGPSDLWSLLEQGRRDPMVAAARIRTANRAPGPSWSSDTLNWPGELTAVFILSQHDAAVRRLAEARERPNALAWLHAIGEGRAFTTVGISHLTTSRRLGTQPVKAVEVAPGAYRLDGTIPWVTAAERAECSRHRRGPRRWPADADRLAGGSTRRGRAPAVSAGGPPGVMHDRGRARGRPGR